MIIPAAEARHKTCCIRPKACEGSNCMAWRWQTAPDPNYRPPERRGVSPPPPVPRVVTNNGYCGLVYRD